MGDTNTQPTSSDISVLYNDPSITFSQFQWWYPFIGQGATYMVTQTYLAQFTYTFVGSYIWYYSDMNNDHGPFSVSIDDVMYGTWTSAWPIERPGVVLFHASVQPGRHTLTVTNLSNNYTSLEHLMYRPLTNGTAPRAVSDSGQSVSTQRFFPGPSQTLGSTAEPQDSSVQSPPPAADKPSTVAYIGIALGVVCFLLLVAIATLVFLLHRRRSSRTAKDTLLPQTSIDSDHGIDPSQALHPFPVPQPTAAFSSSEPSYISRKLDILTFDTAGKEASSSRAGLVSLE
ncbi:hypothetical protein AURDEDRAFT_183523 [Auricularia subglabra TFB-10046 SS5]|nr:hypothetical protein AURDEDRAFT_183523 [Auricularia subglabra TFB-10046 SS5]